ncbi:MAG: DEAD/DEAH box helicase [Bacteroidales bacterium]|nr:DEAD/DEAH box helicase [Bacteroidales bacterium]
MNFNETQLIKPIKLAIEELGFTTLTPIQEKTINLLLESDQDLIGLAETGTGKTAAFGLPLLNKTELDSKLVQTIILSPTRELCMQITKDLENYSKYMQNISIAAVYGGVSIETQISKLKKGAQIVVGTPGRTVDLIKRKALKLKDVRFLVLDEADEMLNMGFKEDIDFILAQTPSEKQTLLFSATMPNEIRQIAETYMHKPNEVSIGKKNMGAENVSHIYYVTHAKDRYLALKRIVDINPKMYGIIFCRTRSETKEVADKLIQDGYNADALHGDLSQSQRDFVMHRFRIKHLQLLIATDVAARGLDVDNLTHVINYNLPDELEIYIHRSGRTGRAGKKGISISLLHTREVNKIRNLEKLTGKKFERKLVPNGFEICEKQLFNFIDRVENIEVDEKQIEQYLSPIYKKLDWLSREDLIKHFVSVEFNRFLEYYRDAVDINPVLETKKDKQNYKSERNKVSSYSRFFINVGTKDGLTTPKMIGLINDYCKRRDISIGKIDLFRKFSFFEIDKKFENLVLSSFVNSKFNNIPLTVNLSKPENFVEKKKKNFDDKKFDKKDKKFDKRKEEKAKKKSRQFAK